MTNGYVRRLQPGRYAELVIHLSYSMPVCALEGWHLIDAEHETSKFKEIAKAREIGVKLDLASKA